MNARILLAGLALGLAAAAAFQGEPRPGRVLDAKLHHLGDTATPDWSEASREPEGTRLDVRFDSRANAGEWTLYLRQRSVDGTWRVKIGGVEVARLAPRAALLERAYSLPAGCIREGENVLSIEPDDPRDDIVIGDLRLVESSLRELHRLQPVEVRVVDVTTRAPVPARITFVGAAGAAAPIYYAESDATAVREGFLYAAHGEAKVE